MMEILLFLVAALLIEAIWETSKMIWKDGRFSADRLGAIAIGIVVAVGAGLEILSMVGIYISIPYVDRVLTGLLLSRGANFLHDILGKISQLYQQSKQ